MKGFDFLDVLEDSLTNLPLKIVAVWISCGIGANFARILARNEVEIWEGVFFPVILLFGAFGSGWWMFIAGPILVALAAVSWHYLILDGSASDLIWLLGLSSLIMAPVAFRENFVLGILYLGYVSWILLAAHGESRNNRSSIDHV
ncbi:hypothetical protein V2O64_09645 [Verrucomicrobiaceae bacterium 227]